MRLNIGTILPRLLIGLVLVANVQCAVLFLTTPGRFAPGFELNGVSGEAAVRGMGILFLMWNIPYAFAFLNPREHRLSVWESVLMQATGVVGESLIWFGLPPGHEILAGSIGRFLLFDSAGLVFLLLAAFLSRPASGRLRYRKEDGYVPYPDQHPKSG